MKTVLDDAVSRPESFSGEVLLRTRRRLGVSEVVAGGMHLDMYQTAIQVGKKMQLGHAVDISHSGFQPASAPRASFVMSAHGGMLHMLA